MKTVVIVLSLAVIVLGWLLYDSTVTSNARAGDAEARERFHRNRADSLDATYKARIEQDSLILLHYGQTVQRANQAEQRARKAEIALKYEKNLNRRFSDATTDSLLSRIR